MRIALKMATLWIWRQGRQLEKKGAALGPDEATPARAV